MPSPFLITVEDPYDFKQIAPRQVPNPELTIPDDSYTIGELFNRYTSGESIGQVRRDRSDNNLSSPLRYDHDLDSLTTAHEITYNTYNDEPEETIVNFDSDKQSPKGSV